MNSNSTQLCRLCLETSADDLVNICETFEDSTIASVLAEHFWFQDDKKDGVPEWVCGICWNQTKAFHLFFKRVEFRHQNSWPINLASAEKVKLERSVSTIEEGTAEADLNLVKCETELDIESDTDDMRLIAEEESCDDDNNDSSCDKSETRPNSDDEDNLSIQKLKNKVVIRKKRRLPIVRYTPSENEKELAQIRQFVNMKCEICSDFEFKTLLSVRQHYRSVHNMDGYLVCCRRKFYYRHRLLDHINFHLNPDRHRCDQCNKSLASEKSLRNHMEGHVPLDSRAHKCSYCTSSFVTQPLLRAHVKNVHDSKTGETFACEQCGKNFRSSLLLSCHIRGVHEFSLEHVCETCSRGFKTKTFLRLHISHEHTETPKVQCDVCGAWSKNKIRLRQHIERSHRVDAVTVNCSICNEEKRSKRALSAHMRTVHGERQHQCSLCNKKFKRAKNLKEHIACHTGEDLYDCPYCDKKFKSNANMYAHRKKAHLTEWARDRANKSTEQQSRGGEISSG